MFSKGRSDGCLLKAAFTVLAGGGREGRGGGAVWSHSTLTEKRFAGSGFIGQLDNLTVSILGL